MKVKKVMRNKTKKIVLMNKKVVTKAMNQKVNKRAQEVS